MAITALYAGLLAFFYIALSFRVIFARQSEKVEIGTGESSLLMRRARVHANFAEYAPYALLLIALAESLSAPSLLVHAAGATLTLGRVAHAYGFSNKIMNLRALGMVLTFTSLGIAAGTCVVLGTLEILAA